MFTALFVNFRAVIFKKFLLTMAACKWLEAIMTLQIAIESVITLPAEKKRDGDSAS